MNHGNFGAIIIGDEIMLGRREDRHFAKLREAFSTRGLKLSWVLYLGDERQRLTSAFQLTLAGPDVVFCFGGIGATPDDHTRQAVSAATGKALTLHPDAEREIRARMAETGQEVTPERLAMGMLPEGSRIIPNPYNRIPGFSFREHHFFPGFPVMAHPMLEWVLDTCYSARFNESVEAEASIRVWEGLEAVMTPLMVAVEAKYPGLKVFSLPHVGSDALRRHVELGVRGTPSEVEPALQMLRDGVDMLGFKFDEI